MANTEWNPKLLNYLDLHPKNKYWKNFIRDKLDKFINHPNADKRRTNRLDFLNIIHTYVTNIEKIGYLIN